MPDPTSPFGLWGVSPADGAAGLARVDGTVFVAAASEPALTEREAIAAADHRAREEAALLTTRTERQAAATERAVAHGDVGISTPSDGGKSFIAETPEGREAYQPTGTIAAAEKAQGI